MKKLFLLLGLALTLVYCNTPQPATSPDVTTTTTDTSAMNPSTRRDTTVRDTTSRDTIRQQQQLFR